MSTVLPLPKSSNGAGGSGTKPPTACRKARTASATAWACRAKSIWAATISPTATSAATAYITGIGIESRQSVNLAAGYKNRSITRSFGIVPFAEQNWLGGSRYNRSFGAHTDFSRRLNARWRVMLNAGYVRKHYQDHRMAARYDAEMPLAGATLLYTAPEKLAVLRRCGLVARHHQEAEQASDTQRRPAG